MSLKSAKFNLIFLIHCVHYLQNKLPLTTDPIEIGPLVPKIPAVEGWVAKAIGNKEFICFVWLHLKISICKFWLILLDQIKFEQVKCDVIWENLPHGENLTIWVFSII